MALTDNQLTDVFKNQFGRTPNAAETSKYSGADLGALSNMSDPTYALVANPNGGASTVYNKTTNQAYATPQDFAKDVGVDPSQLDWSKFKFDTAYQPGQQPYTQPTPEDPSKTPFDATKAYSDSYKQLGGDTAKKTFTDAQAQINQIDSQIESLLSEKLAQAHQSGGIVSENQLREEVANENQHLMLQKSALTRQLQTAQSGYNSVIRQAQNQAQLSEKSYHDKIAAYNASSRNSFNLANLAQRTAYQGASLEQRGNYQQASVALKAAALQTRKSGKRGSGTAGNSVASQELLAAIQSGTIDPSRVNSRTINLYNQIAKAGVNAVDSHAGASAKTKSYEEIYGIQKTAQRLIGVLDKNLPLVSNLADKVNTTGIPWIDDYKNGFKSYTGNDTNLGKYVNSLKTIRTEYANMLAKGSAVTETERRDAIDAIPSGKSGDFYRALGEQLKLEGSNVISSAGDTLNTIFPSSPDSSSKPSLESFIKN